MLINQSVSYENLEGQTKEREVLRLASCASLADEEVKKLLASINDLSDLLTPIKKKITSGEKNVQDSVGFLPQSEVEKNLFNIVEYVHKAKYIINELKVSLK